MRPACCRHVGAAECVPHENVPFARAQARHHPGGVSYAYAQSRGARQIEPLPYPLGQDGIDLHRQLSRARTRGVPGPRQGAARPAQVDGPHRFALTAQRRQRRVHLLEVLEIKMLRVVQIDPR